MPEIADTVHELVTNQSECANRFAIFSECPHCGGSLHPEHAHFKCSSCGWRDSCCDWLRGHEGFRKP